MIILFDLDGTLIDSTQAIVDSFMDVHNFYELDLPKEDKIVSLIGYPLEKMFLQLGANEDSLDELVLKYKEFYRPRSLGMTTLLEDAKEAIVNASKIARLGIVTTKVSERTNALLKSLEVSEYFEVVIGRDSVTNPKPDPEPVLKALKYFENVEYDNAFMIGDTYMDIVAANKADVTSIGVLCGSGTQESFEVNNAKYICKNAYEAVKLIQDNYATS